MMLKSTALMTILPLLLAACSGQSETSTPITQRADQSLTAWSAQEMQAYLAHAAQAEKIMDDMQRCLAYPDLPGNNWMPGTVSASCGFLKETHWTLERLESVLSQPDGAAQLDAAFAAIAKEQASHPNGGDPLLEAFAGLEPDARSRKTAQAWLTASPQSPYAMTALGLVELDSAFKARGEAWINLTSPQQIQAMQRHLSQAQPLFEKALAMEPNTMPACLGLIRISRLNGDDALTQTAIAHCDKIDGASFAVMQARKMAAETRWGGAAKEMEQVIQDTRKRVALNPALGILLGNDNGETGVLLAKDEKWKQAYPYLQKASARAPEAEILAYAGRTANHLSHNREAFIYLSQALRFKPRASWYRRWLARVYMDTQQWMAAFAQLERARAANANAQVGLDYNHLGWVAGKHGEYAVAKQAYQQALNDPKAEKYAAISLCDIAVRRENDLQAALRCTQKVASDYPKDPMAVFMRAWVLTENRQPGAEQAAQAYFTLPQGLDKRQPQLSEQLVDLRKRIGKSM